jgi:hypothetical protein
VFKATGQWQDGSSCAGPAGSATPWTDNFLNLTDIGKVTEYAAVTRAAYWDSLVGYIGPAGSSPPERGSYATPNSTPSVQQEAMRVFPIFPPPTTPTTCANVQTSAVGVVHVKQAGQLWLIFNADAYSSYTYDNIGSVTVTVENDSGSPPNPDLEPVCPAVGFVSEVIELVCTAANQFVAR